MFDEFVDGVVLLVRLKDKVLLGEFLWSYEMVDDVTRLQVGENCDEIFEAAELA